MTGPRAGAPGRAQPGIPGCGGAELGLLGAALGSESAALAGLGIAAGGLSDAVACGAAVGARVGSAVAAGALTRGPAGTVCALALSVEATRNAREEMILKTIFIW